MWLQYAMHKYSQNRMTLRKLLSISAPNIARDVENYLIGEYLIFSDKIKDDDYRKYHRLSIPGIVLQAKSMDLDTMEASQFFLDRFLDGINIYINTAEFMYDHTSILKQKDDKLYRTQAFVPHGFHDSIVINNDILNKCRSGHPDASEVLRHELRHIIQQASPKFNYFDKANEKNVKLLGKLKNFNSDEVRQVFKDIEDRLVQFRQYCLYCIKNMNNFNLEEIHFLMFGINDDIIDIFKYFQDSFILEELHQNISTHILDIMSDEDLLSVRRKSIIFCRMVYNYSYILSNDFKYDIRNNILLPKDVRDNAGEINDRVESTFPALNISLEEREDDANSRLGIDDLF